MKRLVIPTVFATSLSEFKQRFEKLCLLSKNIHVDVMDNAFVPVLSPSLEDLPVLKRKGITLEVHLMVVNPSAYLEDAKKNGFDSVIFHYESCADDSEVTATIKAIKKFCMKPVIAINPDTPSAFISPFLKSVSGLLIMGVNPGKEHQEFIPEIFDKIKKIRLVYPGIFIQVDGGINIEVASGLAKIGVNAINTGSFVSESVKPSETLKQLVSAFR